MTITAPGHQHFSRNVAAAAAATVITVGGLAVGGIVLSAQDATTTQAPGATLQGPPPPVSRGHTHRHARPPQLLLRLHGRHAVGSYRDGRRGGHRCHRRVTIWNGRRASS